MNMQKLFCEWTLTRRYDFLGLHICRPLTTFARIKSETTEKWQIYMTYAGMGG